MFPCRFPVCNVHGFLGFLPELRQRPDLMDTTVSCATFRPGLVERHKVKRPANNVRLGGKNRGEQWWHLLVIPIFADAISVNCSNKKLIRVDGFRGVRLGAFCSKSPITANVTPVQNKYRAVQRQLRAEFSQLMSDGGIDNEQGSRKHQHHTPSGNNGVADCQRADL